MITDQICFENLLILYTDSDWKRVLEPASVCLCSYFQIALCTLKFPAKIGDKNTDFKADLALWNIYIILWLS
jgi:hypothetical protein